MPRSNHDANTCLEGRCAAAGPAEVRAYLDDLVERQPELFERMARPAIRRYRPLLGDDDALSIAYDATIFVVGVAERSPIHLDTVMGLVRVYARYAAQARLREVAPRHEVPAGIGSDLPCLVPGIFASSLTEEIRAASGLRTVSHLGGRLCAALPAALRDGDLRLSAEQLAVLAAPCGALSADAAARKRLERTRSAIVAWVRRKVVDEGEQQLIEIVLCDHRAGRDRRSAERELMHVLGLDRVILERMAAAGHPSATAATLFALPHSS